ncbi:MAG: CoA-binding protein [Pseudomonadota bacterium]
MTDDQLREILTKTKSIAVVGASPNSSRPSHGVTGFLVSKGFQVFAVNPGHAGKVINGAMTYASLNDLPKAMDMIDVFRASEFVSDVVDAVMDLSWKPKVIWTQLNVRDDAAADRARSAWITVVQDKCPAIEMPRLGL